MHTKQAEAFATGEWEAAGGSRAALQLSRPRGGAGGDDVPIGDQDIRSLRLGPGGAQAALVCGLEDELEGLFYFYKQDFSEK